MINPMQVDDVLRAKPGLVRGGNHVNSLLLVAIIMIVFGGVYGAVMGSFSGARFVQMLFSAMKLPILLVATFALSLPSFFVVTTLVGLRDDFAASVRAIATTQAGLTIILFSLAPFTVLWYVSFERYEAAILFNLLMFAVASISSQWLLRRFYQPLIRSNPRHRVMMWGWLLIYAFVGIQMGWVLRPFIGQPDVETTFFRAGAWGNAYSEVLQIAWRLVSGG
jgi:hypothetical protein